MERSSSEEQTISSTCSPVVLTLTGVCNIRNVRQIQRNKIKETLRLKNPSYEQAIRTNPKARYALSQWIKYYQEQEDGSLEIPLGCWRRTKDFLERSNCKVTVEDRRVSQPVDVRQSTIKLRDYQQGIPERCLEAPEGIFRLATGMGKTVVALKVHEILKQKTLYIVPRLDLLDNVSQEYEHYFGTTPGIIQGNKFDIKDFTVATIQSLQKRIARGVLSSQEFGLVIADEIHLYVPAKSRRAIQHFSPRFLYGFTGTLDRTDGQGAAISWMFGPTLEDRDLPGLVPKVRVATYSGSIPTFQYSESVDLQVSNERRNQLIVDLLRKSVTEGRRVICLTKRVEHYQLLGTLLAEYLGDGIVICNSDDKRVARKEKMAQLKISSDYKVIFGTLALLGVGVDIPSADTLLIAGDLKSSVLTTQAVGRIRRLFDGKKQPEVIDIYDSGCVYFRKQGKLRQKHYESLGWEITNYEDSIPRSL